jgi:hypothetical protein
MFRVKHTGPQAFGEHEGYHHELWIVLLALLLVLASRVAGGHCDGMDGPVVGAAQKALDTGNINHVLIWVRPEHEGAVRNAFATAKSKHDVADHAASDMAFFEVVVSEHRAGEGEPYTGIQPAGRDLGPAIPAADESLETGSCEGLNQVLQQAVKTSLRERFEKARRLQKFDVNDVKAGREYVAAYVSYVHYAEELYEKAAGYTGESAHLHHDAATTSTATH